MCFKPNISLPGSTARGEITSLTFQVCSTAATSTPKSYEKALFIALGVNGTLSVPEEFYLIHCSMVGYDKIITAQRFEKCR